MSRYLKKLEEGIYLDPQELEFQTFVKLPDRATGNCTQVLRESGIVL